MSVAYCIRLMDTQKIALILIIKTNMNVITNVVAYIFHHTMDLNKSSFVIPPETFRLSCACALALKWFTNNSPTPPSPLPPQELPLSPFSSPLFSLSSSSYHKIALCLFGDGESIQWYKESMTDAQMKCNSLSKKVKKENYLLLGDRY